MTLDRVKAGLDALIAGLIPVPDPVPNRTDHDPSGESL
jgi:hypothetical protein